MRVSNLRLESFRFQVSGSRACQSANFQLIAWFGKKFAIRDNNTVRF
jgi:hypothetical protein